MSRKTHLVGAWPGRAPEHAMEAALRRLAPHLNRLSDGETGDRHLWVTPAIETFRANPDVEQISDGDWTGYDDTALYRVREGVTLHPANIRLGYARAFEGSFAPFKILRERAGRGDLRFQVGIPSPLDVAVDTFGEAAFGEPSIIEAVEAATLAQIDEVFQTGGDEVVFQIETVVALVAVAQAPAEQQPGVAGQMAAGITGLAARAPAGARFGIHLCLGDFHHRAFGKMRDVRPLVLMANGIASGWPEGRALDYIHAPFAAAQEPPIADQEFYEPLAELDLGEQTRFIAGFIHESLDLERHRELLARIEGLVGREVDVAAACGLGRRPSIDQVWDAMDKAAALIEGS